MTRILDRIDEPAQLRKFSLSELKQLADEIREVIISTVNKNGGHMASNLGVVELTIALHRVFESPKDKIVWDTSNQCYTHKLLTGRRDNFCSIRTHGGLSGFLEPRESSHDAYCAGHAGTAPSIALGYALGAQLRGETNHAVAILGDGALTAGLSYEGLNNIVQHKPGNLMVILNDNGMSISENIGWLTRWRDKMALHPDYLSIVQRSRQFADRFSQADVIYRLAKRLKDSLQGLIIPSMFWEEMGFKYLGPIDGHNIHELESIMTIAKGYTEKPPLIHVITEKGKGYPPAEQDPIKYHQPASPNGASSSAPTYSQVFASTLIRLMQEDERYVAISAAMLEGTALSKVRTKFPKRVFDVGIAEQHAVTMAAGMAKAGLRPFVAIYSTFLQRSFDQIAHDVCLQDLPVVLAVDRAGLVGEDGKTHQGVFDISYLRCLPNIVIAAPKDENELQHLVYTSARHTGAMAIRYPRGNGLGVPMDPVLREIPLGTGEIIREGSDVTIIALGSTVYPSLQAADTLAQEGIECTVVNARFVKPLDNALILSASAKTGRVLTVEENTLEGGFGSAVAELLACSGINVRLDRLGIPDEFIEHGPQSKLREILGLDSAGIVQRIKATFPGLSKSRVYSRV
ncbi:MAG: 1-deoxy-D-xylulose-5-phosphate synthase [Chloroflexi bacterium]|nr:1-deoxy-D-xylulose-5-phosphate synthase [Chloroflexota bacterium]